MENKAYENLSDEELAARFQEGDRGAVEFLMEKYRGLVKSIARRFHILGGTVEDLNQEGMIGLYKAACDYDSGRDAGFRTFAQLCITRQIFTAVQADGRLKNQPLNQSVSLETQVPGTDGEAEKRLQDLFDADGRIIGRGGEESGGQNPLDAIVEGEDYRRLLARIRDTLSPLERQVIELYITGLDYVGIARILNRDPKSTDNALQRAKSKIRKLVKM